MSSRAAAFLLRPAIVALIALSIVPAQVEAQTYVVQSGDSLSGIAQRYHIAVGTLARLNHLQNINLIRAGQVLTLPGGYGASTLYRVQWGDTLSGLSARYGISIAAIRAMNPSLGPYLLAGQTIRLCSSCGGASTVRASAFSTPAGSGAVYIVQPGDSAGAIAAHYGVSLSALVALNGLLNPGLLSIGARLRIPASAAYDPAEARASIVSFSQYYGVSPVLSLAIGWEESGFNQSKISATGAIGVMQVEPYTADHIAQLWGRRVNLYDQEDNIRAGVYWLAQLLAYYGGNERLAIAAYYQGTASIARRGFFTDTENYVANVLALESSFT